MPVTHETAQRLLAVSGSSGRLVVSGPRPRAADAERTWPGQVFEDPDTAYDAAMQDFVRRSAPRTPRRPPPKATCGPRQEADEQAARRSRRQQRRRLAQQRAQVLAQRQQEDAAWEVACRVRRAWLHPARWTPTVWAAHLIVEDQWLQQKAQRQTALVQREQEDAPWAATQQHRPAPLAPHAPKPPWVAILVLTDNCTRQCRGLPLFAVGAKVTAEEVVAALRALLPADLPFLISDRGTPVTAQPFAQLAQEEDVVHVLIARHRPASNGSAERFVRTLKEWLAAHAWSGTKPLEHLLDQFRTEYNARPHQGLAVPGLSPNEFAARIWLL